MTDDQDGSRDARADKHVGPDRSSPYPVSRLSGRVSLVDSAREIERADQWLASTSSAKLEQIAAQMKALRQQAEQVLADARDNAELHRAEARFERQPGQIYHLYERTPGQRYWSMLSPEDWGSRAPHGYLGSYRLEGDRSWTPLERIAQRDQEQAPFRDWLSRGLADGLPAALTPRVAQTADRTHSLLDTEKETACESSSSPPSDPTDPA